ncbi:cation diffusion facilitator family transporter [Trueperella sp. LYQ143]|uniref:cation diffusion facilitator family transporter n=1 Tax=unclassified Trueperella TaxID=2630174 RepID=UPI0039838FA1
MAHVKSSALVRYAWLSIVVAIITISIKAGAYLLTGSVSLLSDAMESVVNLVAAIIALIALKLAAAPATSRYTFGRSKAEYFSAAVEGAMIFGAAALIFIAAITRLFHPQPVTHLGWGLLASVLATILNGITGLYLRHIGRRERSLTLEADGIHLLTDVLTTLGVILGLSLALITHWDFLDPLIAICVALNIITTGIKLLRQALAGLLDVTLPDEENACIVATLRTFTRPGQISFHGLQTRRAGRYRHIKVDLQVPGQWSVQAGHDLAMQVEEAIGQSLDSSYVVIHVEPIEDAQSYTDIPEGYVPLGDDEGLRPIP